MGADISVILDEEGCQTVKAWRQSRETQGLDGKDGFGNPLTPLQIKTAIKIHQMAADKKEDYDMLADELDLDIEKDALQVIDDGSPVGTRQIVRKFNVKQEYVPLTFSDLTAPTPCQGGKQGFQYIGSLEAQENLFNVAPKMIMKAPSCENSD